MQIKFFELLNNTKIPKSVNKNYNKKSLYFNQRLLMVSLSSATIEETIE